VRLPSELGDSPVVVVVVDRFPDQRSEDDDDQDDDQETPASYRYRPRRRSLSVGNKEIETNDELLPSGGGLSVNLLQPLPRFLV
jgi:hypothetical protein